MNTIPTVLDTNLSVVSNAVALATQVVLRVAGNDASTQLNGASITEASVSDFMATNIVAPFLNAPQGV